MRHLVLADLHGNLEAVETVLERAGALGHDRVLLLGDLVGYGADPNAVLDRLRALPDCRAIRGNHDKVAAGLEEAVGFAPAARIAADWTREVLTGENRAFLAALARGPREIDPLTLIAHGSPLDEDAYLLVEEDARDCFESLPFSICFFGHSHWPCAFILSRDGTRFQPLAGDQAVLTLAPGDRHLVNPGSVGQPRDHDPRTSFAIYDDEARTVTVHRFEYPHEEARRKILEAGLPAGLGDRLRRGM
jgi:predicted phosphodiesterase